MEVFPLTALRLQFRAQAPPRLGDFPGAVWRGALGARLRDHVCITRAPDCRGCPVLGQCPYPVLFEPRSPMNPPSALLSHNGRTTPPFVLVPEGEGTGPDDGTVVLGLNLVGPDVRNAALLVRALEEAAKHGLGRMRQPLQRLGVEQADLSLARGPEEHPWRPLASADLARSLAPPARMPVPPAPEVADVHFVSPVRMRIRGRYVGPRDFDVVAFARTILRRATHLGASHCPGFDDTRLAELGLAVQHLRLDKSTLRWVERRRYSSRQERSIPMGGLEGRVRIAGDVLPDIWPWLWQGQWWHVGKGTTMGLGCYRIESGPSG